MPRPPPWDAALRLGTALTFAGHGTLALARKPSWVRYLETVGFGPETALALMPLIGALDWIVALVVLVRPVRAIVAWAVFWAFATALIRPISGESVWEFVERGANWACPLALLLVMRADRSPGS